MRRICVVTGSRADYGLLSRLMKLINNEPGLKLQIVATNMHLSPEFGNTYKEIESDGFHIDKKVQMLLSSDSSNATSKSVGLATIGFADAFEDLNPDMLVVLGDRYEILAAVTAALFYKIPIAHIHGGEITEGAYDNCIRHAITKMSHLHFTSTNEYRNRVIQMGENPETVFYMGSLGIDNIRHLKLIEKEKIEEYLSFKIDNKTILVTFHPATLDMESAETQVDNLLDSLRDFIELKIIFTLPNSDTGGDIIIKKINDFVNENRKRSILVKSLGQVRYFSVLKHIVAVVGNSSSGIIEVPSFAKPTLNIGDRQKGRICSQSVFNCGTGKEDIKEGLRRILSSSTQNLNFSNPYDKTNTAENILLILKKISISDLVKKTFYNI